MSVAEVDEYVVMWHFQGERSSRWGAETVDASSTGYTITGLQERSNYTVTVTAINIAGNTTSDSITETTGDGGMCVI